MLTENVYLQSESCYQIGMRCFGYPHASLSKVSLPVVCHKLYTLITTLMHITRPRNSQRLLEHERVILALESTVADTTTTWTLYTYTLPYTSPFLLHFFTDYYWLITYYRCFSFSYYSIYFILLLSFIIVIYAYFTYYYFYIFYLYLFFIFYLVLLLPCGGWGTTPKNCTLVYLYNKL